MKTASPEPSLGFPKYIWIVVRSNGEKHFVDKEPLEGMTEWAKGTDALVTKYQFADVVHVPPPKPKKSE
jgi:hypothetical protein